MPTNATTQVAPYGGTTATHRLAQNSTSVDSFIAEPDSRAQCAALDDNVKEFGLTYFGMTDRRVEDRISLSILSRECVLFISCTGIVHIIGSERGFTVIFVEYEFEKKYSLLLWLDCPTTVRLRAKRLEKATTSTLDHSLVERRAVDDELLHMSFCLACGQAPERAAFKLPVGPWSTL
ncbi:hypothetical protein C8R47DRAFT_610975 [Mycena vitilis]|nr:hypothetical protein C8R47DRAFT_610975 [Mycena vitilis]